VTVPSLGNALAPNRWLWALSCRFLTFNPAKTLVIPNRAEGQVRNLLTRWLEPHWLKTSSA
jgi:hypothetical protein